MCREKTKFTLCNSFACFNHYVRLRDVQVLSDKLHEMKELEMAKAKELNTALISAKTQVEGKSTKTYPYSD